MLHEDLMKQARVQVLEGEYRSWFWLRLRKKKVWRDVWYGHISQYNRSMNGESTVVVSDQMAFLRKKLHV